ncbi:MAG: toxin-antitoxin system, toxin component, PIN family protein [Planctomycetes bacterium]|nr:toxin-antitoxin system, toxin component, PIN family protein [Planctomycetota bacterium]MBM4080391.1 toxin-antitoxin system, toxin component, PIN family protein [Planctomycetota bacterium]MBM4085061.1 toxin-antitoxin system, toxin component, PIN family protein [Planctomycetota bacterium]
MKVLLDTCVWGGARHDLRAAGHDVVWAGEWAEDPGDDDILERAHDEARVLVTLDKDYGELAIVHGKPHRGIVRLVNQRAREHGVICIRILARYAQELSNGAIVTVEPGRVRVRPPEGS